MGEGKETEYPPQYEGNAFVKLFRDRRVFADFVTAFVDVGGLERDLDFASATLSDRKYVSEALREGERDVLWEVPAAGGELFVFLLLEHQSTVDYGMPLRLLFYMNAVWQEHYHATDADFRRSSGFRAPPIVPVVLYTGKRPWNGATRLSEVIARGEALRGLLPDFSFQLIDFCAFDEQDFAVRENFACALLHVVWALMHGVPGTDFARIFEELRPFWSLREVELLLAVLYHYSCAEGRRDVAEELYGVFRPEEVVMTQPEVVRKRFWEVWKEEGRVEGEAVGEARGEAIGEAKGEARKEVELLREQFDAIQAFFARKCLPWEAYSGDVLGIGTHREATDFLLDLATAADTHDFLKQRFGH